MASGTVVDDLKALIAMKAHLSDVEFSAAKAKLLGIQSGPSGPSLLIGSKFPNFQVDTSVGQIDLYKYFEGKWGIMFSHPADFTPVCATELATVASLQDEWAKRNTRVIGFSCDTVEHHQAWAKDIGSLPQAKGHELNFPIIADPKRVIAAQLGMLDPTDIDKAGLPLPVRSVFVTDPNRAIKLILTYPASTGRNFNEIIRALDSLQLKAGGLATPVNWKQGGEAVILPSVSTEQAKEKFGAGNVRVQELPSGKTYLRYAKI